MASLQANDLGGSAGADKTVSEFIGEKVIATYSLAVGAVTHAEARIRIVKGLARRPVPVMLLARRTVVTR